MLRGWVKHTIGAAFFVALILVVGWVAVLALPAHRTTPAGVEGNEKQLVLDYLQKHLNDPSGMEVVEWDGPKAVLVRRQSDNQRGEGIVAGKTQEPERAWEPGVYLYVKFRAKNGFGAKMLGEQVFLIQNGQVAKTATVDAAECPTNPLGWAKGQLGEIKEFIARSWQSSQEIHQSRSSHAGKHLRRTSRIGAVFSGSTPQPLSRLYGRDRGREGGFPGKR